MKIKKSTIIRLIVFIAILVIIIPTSLFTNMFHFEELLQLSFDIAVLIKLIIMTISVLLLETALVLILSLVKPKSHRAKSVISILSSLLKYVAAIIILCWGLSIIGVNVSTIIASVGIIALVVGFSAESLITDVVTGAFMLFENQYNVGDIVEVEGFRGTVTSIGIRTTCITDAGDNVKIFNNSEMKNILNRSDKLSRCVSTIAVPYSTDLEKLETQIPVLMQEIYEKHSDVMKTVPQYLGVDQLADSAVVLKFVANVFEKDIYSGSRILNHDLLIGFKKLGVECPFPQIDVHTDK